MSTLTTKQARMCDCTDGRHEVPEDGGRDFSWSSDVEAVHRHARFYAGMSSHVAERTITTTTVAVTR